MKLSSVVQVALLFVAFVAANPSRHQMRGDEELFMSTVTY